GAAFTHDIDAQGAMRKLRTDVDIALAGFERVEIIPETFPVPAQAFVQGDAGNVFDAFHQFDQAVAVGPADGREADPAVSHHHRGHAVPARRRKMRIPRRLAVVMCVDVDEAGGDEAAFGVDLLAALTGDFSCCGDAPAGDGDVSFRGRAAPSVGDGTAPYDQI